jgi:hypothetical protein
MITAMNDSRRDKWLGWTEGSIRGDVYAMHLNRDVFRELGRMTNDRQPSLPWSYFFDYLGQTYSVAQLIAVRRQAEIGSRVATLGRMLREMTEEPERISREFYVGMWEDDEDEQRRASKTFDAFAGVGGAHIGTELVARDLAALTATAGGVKDYVDEYVAHSDAAAKATEPQFVDLDAAIDSIGEMFKKYHGLLTASTHFTLVPELDHDWKAVFRVPWIAS